MADINLLGLVGNQTYANPLDPTQYDEIKSQQDALLQSYINRPTGPTLGQGLATALAAALPAALGGIIGGKEGLGYGLTAGSSAAKTSLDQIAQANEQHAEGNLLEYMRNRQRLMGADAYNANALDRENKIDDAVTIAEKLKGPQGIETLGQIEVEKARPRSWLGQDQPADDLVVEELAKMLGKSKEELAGLTNRAAQEIRKNIDAKGRAEVRESGFQLPPGSSFWDETNKPSKKVVEDNVKMATATAELNAKLTQLQAEIQKPTTAQNMAAIKSLTGQANSAYKEYKNTGANTTDIEIRKFLEGLTPNVWNNGMTSYMQYVRDTALGVDPTKVLSHSIKSIQNGYSAKSFEQNILTPSVASFVEKAKAAGKTVSPQQIRQLLAEGSIE